LHPHKHISEDFEFHKPKYRELLNSLYKYFMDDAIHKYNIAGKELSQHPESQSAQKMKNQGLNSYRLCWKLLEASVINRTTGHDLDLGRIETSERK
jgi:hypothetical protein